MAIPTSEPKLTAHFNCQTCNLNYRQSRHHFITQECCPICDVTNYAYSWSFTTRNIAAGNLAMHLKDLSEDIAYAVYKDTAYFPEARNPDIPLIEVDADHFLRSPGMAKFTRNNGGQHE